VTVIVDVPLLFMRMTTVPWRIDWRGQGELSGLDGSAQFIYNAMPRFVGSVTPVLPPKMVLAWRAIIARGQGRANAYRVRMLDPLAGQSRAASWSMDWRAYHAGIYVEPRPQAICIGGASAGATEITIDETTLRMPVRVGSYLSYGDWPMVVTGRSGAGAAVVLTVDLLRTDIPDGAAIDCIARGLFRASDDASGWPVYGVDRVATPTLDLVEWITR